MQLANKISMKAIDPSLGSGMTGAGIGAQTPPPAGEQGLPAMPDMALDPKFQPPKEITVPRGPGDTSIARQASLGITEAMNNAKRQQQYEKILKLGRAGVEKFIREAHQKFSPLGIDVLGALPPQELYFDNEGRFRTLEWYEHATKGIMDAVRQAAEAKKAEAAAQGNKRFAEAAGAAGNSMEAITKGLEATGYAPMSDEQKAIVGAKQRDETAAMAQERIDQSKQNSEYRKKQDEIKNRQAAESLRLRKIALDNNIDNAQYKIIREAEESRDKLEKLAIDLPMKKITMEKSIEAANQTLAGKKNGLAELQDNLNNASQAQNKEGVEKAKAALDAANKEIKDLEGSISSLDKELKKITDAGENIYTKISDAQYEVDVAHKMFQYYLKENLTGPAARKKAMKELSEPDPLDILRYAPLPIGK